MKNTLLLITLFSGLFLGTMDAQKYGHLNYGNILEMMPEIKQADAELASLRDKLLADYQGKVTAFETEYRAAEQALADGSLSRVQAEQKSVEFQGKQQKLIAEEQNIQAQIAQKREALLTPLLDKLQNEIDALGKEENYTMIFDTSSGAMLFAKESEDLTEKIKTRLGL